MRKVCLNGKNALVTGAGSGIGRGIALALARRGARVLLAGRRPMPLTAVAAEIERLGGQAVAVSGDVTDAAQRRQMLAAAHDAFGPLHILVNNAGVLASGSLLTLSAGEIEAAIATNLAAPIDLVRLALPDLMYTRGAAVFVGSTTSHVPLPYTTIYSATKSGLHAFCTALRYELAPLGVHLLEAYPPAVATAMTASMAAKAPAWQPRPQNAGAAGERIVAALAAGQAEVQWGAGERLLIAGSRLAPRLLHRALGAQRSRFAHAMTPGGEASGKPPAGASLEAQLAAVRAAHPGQVQEIGGQQWRCVAAGRSGDVLLLLPGALGEADTSFQYIQALQDDWRVLSLGYPAALDRLPALLAGLEEMLDCLGVEQAHVVGGSYSGFVAQLLAARAPRRVSSLLLSNTGAPGAGGAQRWRLAAAALGPLPAAWLQRLMQASIRRFLPDESPDQVFWRSYFAAALPQWSKQAVQARLRLLAQMLDADSGRAVRQAPYHGPVLIVHAENDRLAPHRQHAELAALYPQAQHVQVPNKGHAASLDEAAAYIQLYREFLS